MWSFLKVPFSLQPFRDAEDDVYFSSDSDDYIGGVGGVNEEETDEDSDDENGEELYTDDPLYKGSSVTKKEALILMHAYIFRHNSSKQAVSDFLKIAARLVPKGESACIPSSYYKFMTSLNIDIKSATKHYYCQRCQEPVTKFSVLCKECNTFNSKKDLESKDQYFYQLDLTKVLSFCLNIPSNGDDVLKNIRKRQTSAFEQSTVFEDVMDGDAYKNLGNVKVAVKLQNIAIFVT